VVSIDLGYGYVKAVSKGKRVIFPSVVAPAQESTADFGRSLNYVLEYRSKEEITKHKMFVGDIAAKEGRAIEASLNRTKFTKQASIAMALAAAYILGCEKQSPLVLGLPLAYYKNQREDVRNAFQKVAAHVSVNGGPERHISFSKIEVFPQGVGAVYAQSDLPEKGMVGLLDIGFYTTNYVLFECTTKDIEPLRSYNSTIEIGVSTAMKLFSEKMRQLTGTPISLTDAQYLWRKKRVSFRGVSVDPSLVVDEIIKMVVKSLTESVISAWSEKIDWLDDLLLSGGGSLEFYNEIKKLLPLARLAKEPQFANALGYIEMAGAPDDAKKSTVTGV